jgi:hypothetical protein
VGSVGVGRHPLQTEFQFVTSVFVTSGSVFRPFTKTGGWVLFGTTGVDIASAFAGTLTGNFETVDLAPTDIPQTTITMARIRVVLQVNTVNVSVGDRVELDFRHGATAGFQTRTAIRPANSDEVEFVIDTVLGDEDFEVRVAITDYSSLISARLIGYAEGYISTATDLGA